MYKRKFLEILSCRLSSITVSMVELMYCLHASQNLSYLLGWPLLWCLKSTNYVWIFWIKGLLQVFISVLSMSFSLSHEAAEMSPVNWGYISCKYMGLILATPPNNRTKLWRISQKWNWGIFIFKSGGTYSNKWLN